MIRRLGGVWTAAKDVFNYGLRLARRQEGESISAQTVIKGDHNYTIIQNIYGPGILGNLDESESVRSDRRPQRSALTDF